MRRRWTCRSLRDEVGDLARQIDVLVEYCFERGVGRQPGDLRRQRTGGLCERQSAERLRTAERKIEKRRTEQIRSDLGKHRTVGKPLRIGRADGDGLQPLASGSG